MNRHSRIFVAGADTLIGASLLDLFNEMKFTHLVGAEGDGPALIDPGEVDNFFRKERPEFVFLAAGKSGGIGLNRERPAELMLDNLRSTANVVDAAYRHGAAKLLYLASSCAYPKEAPQPLCVESLGGGPLEPTSEAYATAKLAGWQLCQAYRRQFHCRFVTAVPANAFGPHDDFTTAGGHVIPALIRRAHDARQNDEPTLTVWGTGKPRREFIFARDLADACLFAMRHYDGETPINLGGGTDISIADAARTIADVVGFHGRLVFDSSKPDGAPFKALDSRVLLGLGWRPSTHFRSAVMRTYDWFLRTGMDVSSQTPDAIMTRLGRVA